MRIHYDQTSGNIVATLIDVAGVIVSSGTVTLSILNNAGTPITGDAWPVTMAEGPLGTYTYTIDSDLLSLNEYYIATIKATKSGVTVFTSLNIQVVRKLI